MDRKDSNGHRSVVYAFGGTLGGGGIGRIAGHAVSGATRAGQLSQCVTMVNDLDPVPNEKIETVPFGRFVSRIPNYYVKDTLFDWLCDRHVDDPDLFHGWNNMCLRSLRVANDSGAVTVVERASTHPAVQRDLVETEFEQFGVDETIYNDRQFQRAVAELAEADIVFVPSEFVYESFLEQGFHDSDLRLIPFGVDIETFTPPSDFAREDREFMALFVGQISLRKGVQYLLPAWDRADVDGTLVFAGEVTDDAKHVVEEYRDSKSIEFLGWVDDMADLYKRASVFAFPSIEEGSALVSYEAMASGLPSVVTPNVGSLVEDGRHGTVVEPRDVDAIADSLEEFASDPSLRRKMGHDAREAVVDYTWKKYGDTVAKTYDELLSDI
jgi:glycosyltransferase involved in cell wall biosynthesis